LYVFPYSSLVPSSFCQFGAINYFNTPSNLSFDTAIYLFTILSPLVFCLNTAVEHII